MSDKFKYTAGLNNVGSYQVSGKPFVTASTISDGVEQQIEFPQVTNNVTVKLDSASGTAYNSLHLNGQVAFTSSLEFDGSDLTPTSSFSISWWGLQETASSDTNDILMGFGPSNAVTNALRVTFNNRLQFQGSNTSTALKFLGSIPQDEAWHHFVFTLESNDSGAHHTGSVYVNGSLSSHGTNVTEATNSPNLQLNEFSNSFFIGGTSTKDPEHYYRDVILWDGLLSPSQANALYQASASYGDAAFSPAGLRKLIWVKPTDAIAASVTSLANLGEAGDSTLGVLSVGTTTNDIVSDSPFTDISGGELRVHFRSTGSSNVETNKHYWTLDGQNESITMNVKSKEIYLSADGGDIDYSLQADLTNMPSSRMYQHTGSGVDE
jgi:hypothetical protein